MKLSERTEERKIEEKIAQLRAEAEELDIYGKAAEIAQYLGDRRPKKHGANVNYSTFVPHGGAQHSLGIWWDSFAPNLTVSWDGRQVFAHYLGTGIKRYRPDIEGWIEALEEIHVKKVMPILDERKAEKIHQRAREMKENWGIEVEQE